MGEEIRRAAPSIEEVARDVRAGAARGGFRPDAFEPFIERLPRLLDADARITHDGLLAHGLEPVVSRFIAHRDGRYLAVTYLYAPQATDLTAIEATIHSGATVVSMADCRRSTGTCGSASPGNSPRDDDWTPAVALSFTRRFVPCGPRC